MLTETGYPEFDMSPGGKQQHGIFIIEHWNAKQVPMFRDFICFRLL